MSVIVQCIIQQTSWGFLRRWVGETRSLPALEETAASGKEALPVGHDSGNNRFFAFAAFKAQTAAIQVLKTTWIYTTCIFQVVQDRLRLSLAK